MSLNRPVLCISLFGLTDMVQLPEVGSRKLIKCDLGKDAYTMDLTIMDRDIVDDKNILGFSMGINNPQLLPYVVIKHKEHILTYSRAKGAETRLHGSRSLGFGGHMDMDKAPEDLAVALQTECAREIMEEVGLTLPGFNFTHIISDYSNSVGSVHLGVLAIVELTDEQFEQIQIDPTEITDPAWEALSTLKFDKEIYESWSQMVIEHLTEKETTNA